MNEDVSVDCIDVAACDESVTHVAEIPAAQQGPIIVEMIAVLDPEGARWQAALDFLAQKGLEQ